MVGLSQQQHVRQHAQQPMARLTAHKWLMGPWHMHPCWRQRHWHIPELILCVNSIDCLLITYHWRPQLMDSTMPLCYWSCIMPSRRRKHGMLTWGVWLLHDFLVVTEQQKVPCLHANSSISSIHKMGAIQRRRKMWGGRKLAERLCMWNVGKLRATWRPVCRFWEACPHRNATTCLANYMFRTCSKHCINTNLNTRSPHVRNVNTFWSKLGYLIEKISLID